MDSVEVKPLKAAYPTINQRRMLIELLAADQIIKRGFPAKKGHLQDAYELHWQIIADKLNNADGPQKSVIQWKCTWANIRKRAKNRAPTYMQETSDEVRNSLVKIISPKAYEEIKYHASNKKTKQIKIKGAGPFRHIKRKQGTKPRLTYEIKQENTNEVHNTSVEEIHPTAHQETESQFSPHSFNQTDDDTSQPNKEISVQGYRSIGDCCRQLIQNIANSIHENKTENEVISSMCASKNEYYKLQTIWSDMKTLAIAKLNYLFDANDLGYTLAEKYQMTITDWQLFDTVLVHQDVDVIGIASKPFKDKPGLRTLFELAVEYDVDKLAGDELANAWSTITLLYNDNKRTCTPVLLQRRWYQMKLATRIRFYSTYKASKRDMQLINIDMPTRLQIEIVNWDNSLLTKPFVMWDDLVKTNRVISRTQFELIALKRKLTASIISTSAANVAIVNSDIGSQSNKTPLEIIHNDNVPCSDTTTEVVINEENELAPRNNVNNLNPVDLIPIIVTNQASSVIETMQMEQNVVIIPNKPEPVLPKITNIFGNVHVTNETLWKICDMAAQIKNKSISNSVVKEPEHKIMNTKDKAITILSDQIISGATINPGPSTAFGKVFNEVDSIPESFIVLRPPSASFGEVSNDVDSTLESITIAEPSTSFGEVPNDVDGIPKTLSLPEPSTLLGEVFNDVDNIPKTLTIPESNTSFRKVSNDVDNIPKTLSILGPSTAFGKQSNDVVGFSKSPTILRPPSTSFDEVFNDVDNIPKSLTILGPSTSFCEVSNDVDIIPKNLTILGSSISFGEISNNVELADDGIQLDEMMSHTEDILKKIDELISPSNAENHKAKSEDSWDEQIGKKYKDLLKVPIVYTAKLDDMGILPINLLTHVNNKSIIDIIDFKSKPIPKRTSFRKTNGKKLKLSSYLFKKPRIRTYSKEKLRINPDFNTSLLPLKFFKRQHTRALYRLCKPLTVDVSKAFEKHLVNGVMYLGRTHDDEFHKKMALIAKCIASIDDSCQKDVHNTICSSEQKNNTTCIRSKVINLQDISEVRQIKKQLLTAQVMPQQVIKDHSKLSDTSTKMYSDFLKLNPTSLDEVLENVCTQLSAILPESNSLYNNNRPEISDNDGDSSSHVSDPLLSLDELNSLLLLLSIFNDNNNENNTDNVNSDEISYKGCSSDELIYNLQQNNDSTDKLNTPIIQACSVLNNDNKNNIDNPESNQISLKDHNIDNLVHNMLNNTNKKKRQYRQLKNNTQKVPKDGQNVETLTKNDSKKNKFYCCWARQRIYQIKSKRHRVPNHECPYPECLCCCKGALQELYRNLQEKRHANRLRHINKMLNNSILENQNISDNVTENTISDMPTRSIPIQTNKTKSNIPKSVPKLTKLPASSTTMATDNTVAPCSKESSLDYQLTDFLTVKSISSTQSYVTKPLVYSPNNIESVTKSTEINKNNIECLFALNNYVSELPRIKYSDTNLIQLTKSKQSANTNQNSMLGCQRSISSMCLGKNKILLTTTKFPPNLYRFQEFRRTIKQTLNLPKGIQLKLSPNGRVALYRNSNLEVSQELLEKVTDQVDKFYQRNSDDKINANDQSKTNNSTNINHDNNQLKHSNESSKNAKYNIDQAKSTDDFTYGDSDEDAEDVALAELIRVTKKENNTSDNVEENTSVQLDKSNKNDITGNTLSNLIEISGSNTADISPVIEEDIPLPLVACSMEQQPPLRQDADLHIADIVESRLSNILSKALTPVTTLTELKYAYSRKGIFFKFDLQTGQLVPLNICMKRNTTREQPVIDCIEPEPVPKSTVNLSAHDLLNLAQTPLPKDVLMRNLTFKDLCEITINDYLENANNQLKTYKPNLPNRTDSNTTRDFLKSKQDVVKSYISNRSDISSQLFTKIEQSTETRKLQVKKILGQRAHLSKIRDVTDPDKGNTNDVTSDNSLDDNQYSGYITENVNENNNQKSGLRFHNITLIDFVQDSNKSNFDFSSNSLDGERSLANIVENENETTNETAALLIGTEALQNFCTDTDKRNTNNVPSNNALADERYLVKKKKNMYQKTQQQADLPVRTETLREFVEDSNNSNTNEVLSDNWLDHEPSLDKIMEDVDENTNQKTKLPVRAEVLRHLVNEPDISYTCNATSDNLLVHERGLVKIMENEYKKTEQKAHLPVKKLNSQFLIKTPIEINKNYILSNNALDGQQNINLGKDNLSCSEFFDEEPLAKLLENVNAKTMQKANMPVQKIASQDCLKNRDINNTNYFLSDHSLDNEHSFIHLASVPSSSRALSDELSLGKILDDMNKKTKQNSNLSIVKVILQDIVKDSNNSNIMDVLSHLSHDRQTLAKINNIIQSKRETVPFVGTKPLIDVVKDSNNSNIIDFSSHDRQTLAETNNVVKSKRKTDPLAETKPSIEFVKDSNNSNIIDVFSHDRRTLTKTNNVLTTKPKTDPPVSTKTLINVVKDSNNSNIIDVLSHDRQTLAKTKNVVTTKPKTDLLVGTKSLINVVKDSNNSNIIDVLSDDRQTITKIQNKRETDQLVGTKTSIDIKNSNNSNIIEVLSHDRRTLPKMNNVVKTKRKTDPTVGKKFFKDVVKNLNNGNIIDVVSDDSDDEPLAKIKKLKKSKIKTHLSCDKVAYIEMEYNDGPDKVIQTCGVIDISDESLMSLSDIECAAEKEK